MSDEKRADTVIEQGRIEAAAKVIRHWYVGASPTPMDLARALHDAGLLADPADRDWQMCDQDACEYTTMFKARAERAEAEVERLKHQLAETRAEVDAYSAAQVAELRAEVERLHKIICRQERTIEGYESYPVDGSEVIATENGELRATVAAVRSVCQNTDGDWLDGDAEIPVGEVLRMLTLDGTRTLDGSGEQHG